MLRLLFLPFTIVRRVLWMVVWHSVYFLLKRPALFVVAAAVLLGGILYSGWAAYRSVDLLDETVVKESTASAEGKKVAEVKGKLEDGNSAFATNLLKQMQPFEKQAYSKAFYYAMGSVAPGTEYRWQANPSVYGSITPGEKFKSGRGVDCRRFNELMRVRDINQKFTGISCLRKDGGWCKLRPTSTPVCGLKSSEGWDLWWHNKKLRMNNWFNF